MRDRGPIRFTLGRSFALQFLSQIAEELNHGFSGSLLLSSPEANPRHVGIIIISKGERQMEGEKQAPH